MGCDVCYTNHAEADQDDMDTLLTLLGVAGEFHAAPSGLTFGTLKPHDTPVAHERNDDVYSQLRKLLDCPIRALALWYDEGDDNGLNGRGRGGHFAAGREKLCISCSVFDAITAARKDRLHLTGDE